MRDVEEEEKEEEKGVGNKTKRLFGFSRILRFYVFYPSSSDSCYITEKGCWIDRLYIFCMPKATRLTASRLICCRVDAANNRSSYTDGMIFPSHHPVMRNIAVTFLCLH